MVDNGMQELHYDTLYQITARCNTLQSIATHCITLSYLASMSGVVCVVCPFADDEKLITVHVDLALLV